MRMTYLCQKAPLQSYTEKVIDRPKSPADCSDQLNASQKEIWTTVTTYFQDLRLFQDGCRTKPEPLRLLIHGGPGTGKSFLARCIQQAATYKQFTVACIAPTGIAASNLPCGRTAHNFCGIPIQRSTLKYLEKPNNIKLASLQARAQHQTLALLVIDEISNVGPEMFAQIEKRMKEIMENDEPFGGLSVILMGDFFQLPPVLPGETLYAALLKIVLSGASLDPTSTFTSPRMQGARWFATFRKVELVEQMRAAHDQQHMEFLAQLRSIASDPKPRPVQSLQQLKAITAQDVAQDPSWTNAPIVVTSNEERVRINEQQSMALAKKNKCARIVWYQPILGIVANGLDTTQTNFIYGSCSQFKGVFVAGAPGFLLDNINPKRGLSNGTPVTFHSLILDPREHVNRVLAGMMHGDEDVVLQYNPAYVLVRVTNAKPVDFVGLTAVADDVVIPMAQTSQSKPIKVTIPHKQEKVSLHTKSFGIELGFSITLHKIQGQTCQRLIVDLNRRPFMPQISFPGFYVAASRVRRSQDLRIMPIQPGLANLKYLLELQPPKLLITWLNGFNADGKWDAKRIALPKTTTPAATRPKRKQATTNTQTKESTSKTKSKKTKSNV